MSTSPYPVQVDAHLDAPLSRWLWLVKWLLVIPHCRRPGVPVDRVRRRSASSRSSRSSSPAATRAAIFDFNVGVLRWTWRVAYYAYGALGTDRYPPFTLDDVPDYPAPWTSPIPSTCRAAWCWSSGGCSPSRTT